jgi:hypothetical protein
MAENGYNSELTCHYKNKSSQKALVTRLSGYTVCKWSSYSIECPLNESVDELSISAVGSEPIHKV